MNKVTDNYSEIQDKFRLLIIYVVCYCKLNSDYLNKIIESLKALHNSEFDENLIRALYTKRKVSFSYNLKAIDSVNETQPSGSSSYSSILSGFASHVTS